jgi:hypothetical protein
MVQSRASSRGETRHCPIRDGLNSLKQANKPYLWALRERKEEKVNIYFKPKISTTKGEGT